jgi:DNA repair exonuclease SbcCD nuclease subunit
MKVALVADTHFGARNDSAPMQQNMAKFYERVFFPALDEHNVKAVVHAGDFFDRRKYCNIGTARFVHDTYRAPLLARGLPQYMITGNHDIYYRNSTEVNGIDELYRHDPDVHLYTQPAEIELDGCGILLLPWITENNRAASMKLIAESKCSIVIGHLELSGYQMYRGLANPDGLDPATFNRFEMVMSGHYHHRTIAPPIYYLGSCYPMIWSDYQDPRGFHIFDTETHALTYIENPHSLFVKIVYDDKGKKHDYIKTLAQGILAPDSPHHDAYIKVVVKSKDQPYWFDVMMDCLYKVNVQDVLVVDDIIVDDADEQESTEIPDLDTLTLMREYIDTLSISCDKDELFAYLRDKYQDAVASSQSARLS